MKKTYVVSADIYLLLKNWAYQKDFRLPSEEFFTELRSEFSDYFRQIFPDFILLSEKDIVKGLSEILSTINLPIISLDPVYIKSPLSLSISRTVDVNGKDCGLSQRLGSPPLIKQFRTLSLSKVKEVILVDDVIFSGAMLERIIRMLAKINIRVSLVCAGVGILEGVKRLSEGKIPVKCVYTFDEVIDEVCERDFYPGVPLSGRKIIGLEKLSAPYIIPFGNPEIWASIPKNKVQDFSRFCLKQSISLFKEIEKISNKEVLCQDLDSQIIYLPKDESGYILALEKFL